MHQRLPVCPLVFVYKIPKRRFALNQFPFHGKIRLGLALNLAGLRERKMKTVKQSASTFVYQLLSKRDFYVVYFLKLIENVKAC